jgi:hypothetical protein
MGGANNSPFGGGELTCSGEVVFVLSRCLPRLPLRLRSGPLRLAVVDWCDVILLATVLVICGSVRRWLKPRRGEDCGEDDCEYLSEKGRS